MANIIKTSLINQYQEMKKKHPDAVLLFRIGDFYECFGEDAIVTSNILGITLTRRANGTSQYVELVGFPNHALDTYLPRLIRSGHRVAICEQLEDPKLRKRPSEIITTNPVIKHQNNIVDVNMITSVLSTFYDIINKLYLFEEIRLKTKDIRQISSMIGISPIKAFEECSICEQPSLF